MQVESTPFANDKSKMFKYVISTKSIKISLQPVHIYPKAGLYPLI